MLWLGRQMLISFEFHFQYHDNPHTKCSVFVPLRKVKVVVMREALLPYGRVIPWSLQTNVALVIGISIVFFGHQFRRVVDDASLGLSGVPPRIVVITEQ